MKRFKQNVEEYFGAPFSEVCKIGVSSMGVMFGMSFAYYFLDRIFG